MNPFAKAAAMPAKNVLMISVKAVVCAVTVCRSVPPAVHVQNVPKSVPTAESIAPTVKIYATIVNSVCYVAQTSHHLKAAIARTGYV